MAKIQINNKIIEFDKIVAFGCSHTAGSELADHIILDKSFEETNKIKNTVSSPGAFSTFLSETWTKNNPKDDFDSHISNLNNNYSYINVLSNLLGVKCENLAVGGGSMELSAFTLNDKICNNEIKTDGSDIVFLGLTSRHRFFYFNPDGNLPPSCGSLPNPNTWPNPIVTNSKVHREFLFHFFNDYYMLWRHYLSIFSFIKIAKEYNIPVILQPVIVDLFHEKPWTRDGRDEQESMYQSIGPKSKWDDYLESDIRNWKYIQSLYKLWLKINPYIIDFKIILADAKGMVENSTPCGFGHDNISVHKKFAELLFNRLKV